MKNTVFTVIAVLLLATLCLPAAAQTWELEEWYTVPDGDWFTGHLAFRDNHQVFFSATDSTNNHYRFYKWDFVEGRVWWFDDMHAKHIVIPRSNSSVVIYAQGRFIQMRDADDLSFIGGRRLGIGERDGGPPITHLAVDDLGNYLVALGESRLSPRQRFDQGLTGDAYIEVVLDIWGPNGWQIPVANHAYLTRARQQRAITIHPTSTSPRWYTVYGGGRTETDRIRERYGRGSWDDEYISPYWDVLNWIAITEQFSGGTRLAALDSNRVIHVWNWSGDHLFKFNENERYGPLGFLKFTPNGELLATVGYGGGHNWVTFWDMSQQAEDHSFFINVLPEGDRISSFDFSDNGKLMAISGSDGTVYIYRWTGDSAPTAPAKEAETQPTALLANYPNPFNPETWIPYQLSEPAEVSVSIYSVDGKLVRTLELGQVPAGVYSDKERAAYWDGRNAAGESVASGVYFYTLRAGDFKATRKMVIRK